MLFFVLAPRSCAAFLIFLPLSCNRFIREAFIPWLAARQSQSRAKLLSLTQLGYGAIDMVYPWAKKKRASEEQKFCWAVSSEADVDADVDAQRAKLPESQVRLQVRLRDLQMAIMAKPTKSGAKWADRLPIHGRESSHRFTPVVLLG